MMKLLFPFVLLLILLSTSPVYAEDEGKELFTIRCAGFCHQLPEPSMLKAKQWRMIMTVMQDRMKQKGIDQLTEAEFEKIFSYLKKNSRK
ncbi:MAG: diheme cytochrome c [Deltaproteobacteria bacterium]|nr:diheme cytochrome c [Deltaproteobacteria bacterium]